MNCKLGIVLVLGCLGLSLVGLAGFLAQPAQAQMLPTPTSDRFAPWPTVYPPTQADQGAQEYYQRCMVCHGDRGQGLTDEWRGALDPADQNCWQSGCHSPHHPPGGFEFPKYVPPVIGAGTLTQFKTAQGVFDFIQKAMPYQAPGSLSDEIYWQLTAYLLRANRYIDGKMILDASTAAGTNLSLVAPAPAPLSAPYSRYAWLLILLAGVVIGWLAVRAIRRSS